MKADLKARVYIHKMHRNYQCNMTLSICIHQILWCLVKPIPQILSPTLFFELVGLRKQLRMCDRCLACQGKGAPKEMNYKNFSSTKAWDLTTIYHEGYVCRALPFGACRGTSYTMFFLELGGTSLLVVFELWWCRAAMILWVWMELTTFYHTLIPKYGNHAKALSLLSFPVNVFFPNGVQNKKHSFVCSFFHLVTCVRLPFPAKPEISLHNLNGEDDYSELSSRFKGSAVKTLVWWLARETQTFADTMPEDALTFALVSCTNWCSKELGFSFWGSSHLVYLKTLLLKTLPRTKLWTP